MTTRTQSGGSAARRDCSIPAEKTDTPTLRELARTDIAHYLQTAQDRGFTPYQIYQEIDSPFPIDAVQPPVQRFTTWLAEKGSSDDPQYPADDLSHAWSHWTATKRYCKLHDVDRHYRREHDWYTTVHIVHSIPRRPSESPVAHAHRFLNETYRRKLRNSLKTLGVYDETAGIHLLAPKESENDLHGFTTHLHGGLWIPNKNISLDDFNVLLDQFTDIYISVYNHRSSALRNPTAINQEYPDTTALPPELGRNLPCINARFDARNLPQYAHQWAAAMMLGSDGKPHTGGIRTWRPMWNGNKGSLFKEIADTKYVLD